MVDGTFLEDVLSEREGATFIYTTGGVVAVVVDASPAASSDRSWHVSLVVKDQWVSFAAPVVPFETVARFLDALVEANQ